VTGPREAAGRRAELVARVLARLEAEGVRVVLNAAGDGVRLEAEGPPSAEVVRLARTHRAVLLEALTPAKVEAAGCYSDLSTTPDPAHVARTLAFAGRLEALALTPGHCGVCGRWEALAAPLAHLGECSAGRRAHGWHDGPPAAAVEIHAAHACTAWEGKGYRARASVKRHRPAEPGVRL